MFDWFDLMRQAQQSAGTNMLSQQFGLNSDQTQRAMAAFLPAFAMGMQHAMGSNAGNPMLQNLWGGAYQNLWLNAAQAFSPTAQRNGKQILDQLFGSDDVSRRVANEAAEVVGVNVDVMQQMLPVLAGIYAGGMYHWISGHARIAQKAAKPAAEETTAPDMTEAWSRMCAAWTGAQPDQPKQTTTPLETMMAGFLNPPASPNRPNVPPAWEDMMEKGRDLQKQYLASLQSIFDEAQKVGAGKP